MKALAITPPLEKSLRIVDRPEPMLTAAGEIKLQVLQVGICGTDREEGGGDAGGRSSGKQRVGHRQ